MLDELTVCEIELLQALLSMLPLSAKEVARALWFLS